MTKTKALSTLFASVALLVAAIIVLVGFYPTERIAKESSAASARLTADESEAMLDVVKDGASDFQVVYAAADGTAQDSATADELIVLFRAMGATRVRSIPDSIAEEKEHEILLGETVRQLSKDLMADVKAADPEAVHVWIVAEKDGKVAVVANCDKAYDRAKAELLAFATEDGFALPVGYYSFNSMTQAEIDAEIEANKEKIIEELKQKIASFDDSLFGEREPMDPDFAPDPFTYPTVGQHPRLVLTADMLPEIKALLENPAYADLAEDFWTEANAECDGILAPPPMGNKSYNWTGKEAAIIQAKALAYLLTGDEYYGYQAIYAVKNLLLTFYIDHSIATDIFRIYGWMMFTSGVVYDWCYDLMTELDKSQLVRGVQKYCCEDCVCGSGDKMTIGYPPTGQNALAGHGTNVALMRDYIAFSIAIFDEYPDWWELVGGRFYDEYVPANNVWYQAGMNTQGTNTYIWGKFYAQVWSAWLVKTMSGEMPYHEGIEDVVYGLMGLRLPNNKVFQSGDGKSNRDGHSDNLYSALYLAQALFPSEIMQRNTAILTNNYTSYTYFNSNFMIPAISVILRANGYEEEPEGKDRNEGLPLVWYYGSPMGLMTARDEWTTEAAAVYMKVGEVSGTNHDHQDAGTFQIYYKGCFTSESSVYGTGAGYGTSAHDKWAQGTIAHNGLLVYNPAFVDNEIVWGEKAGAPCVSNRDRYFYSGGQRVATNIGSAETWTTGDCRLATLTGTDYYVDASGKVRYAYIAGDISQAYNTKTVDAIERRMLTVYTDDEEFPMFFIVYDYMKSIDASFQKSFLLHVAEEPVLNGNTAYFEQEEGKIVLTTLTDDAVMRAYGGEEYGTYWINGYENEALGISIPGRKCNITEAAGGTGAGKGDEDILEDNDLWGRIQLDNMGKLEDHLLNVIYVTDAGNENMLTPTKTETDKVIAMQMDGVVAAFTKGLSKSRDTVEFTTEGTGLTRYFYSGLSAGSWTVRVDGIVVAHAYTTEESGLINFVAPYGTVTIEPGKDVHPANSDEIKYVTNGGILPEDAQFYYTHDVEYVLPVIADTAEAKFNGWYLSEDSSERIYSIEEGTRGIIKLYAKYTRVYLEDYETSKVAVRNASKKLNKLNYGASKKDGASFITANQGDNTYVLWRVGEKDPELSMQSALTEYITNNVVTFSLDLALEPGCPAINSHFRFRALTPEAEAANATSSHCANIFRTTAGGEIMLGSSDIVAARLTEDFQRLTFTVDFNTGTVYFYTRSGLELHVTDLTLASADKKYTYLEYMNFCSTYVFNWRSVLNNQESPDASLRIDNINIYGGYPKNAHEFDESANDAIIYHYPKELVSIIGEFAEKRDPDKATLLPKLTEAPELYTFEGWYSDPEHTDKIDVIPAGNDAPYHVYAWIKHYSENPYAMVYHNLDGATLPEGLPYYRDPSVSLTLPELVSPDGYEFLGWYTDQNLTNQIFEIAASDDTAPIHLYARWRMEWSEDYENSEVNSYYENEGEGERIDSAGGISYTAKGYQGASYKTVKDDATGNTYVLWTQAKVNSQMYTKVTGGLKAFIGEDTAVTYRVKIALEPGKTPTPSRFRVQQTGSQSITVFQVAENGDITLNANNSLKIATLTEEFTEIIVTVDFARATITVYNEDGTVKTTEDGTPLIIRNLKQPSTSEATSLLDFIGYTKYGFVWQATTTQNSASDVFALRIDDIHMNSGVYNMKKYTVESTDILYEGLNGGTVNGEYPTNYDRENGTALPTDVSASNAKYAFGGWYADAELTVPVTEIPAGYKGPFVAYAKWVYYTDADNAIIYNVSQDASLPIDAPYLYNKNAETPLPETVTLPEEYVFLGWYSDPEYQTGIEAVPEGMTGHYNVYARIVHHSEAENGIVYHCPSNATLPDGLKLFRSEDAAIALPDSIEVATPYGFGGWYSDPEFTTRITEIPAGITGGVYNVYVRVIQADNTIIYKNIENATLPEDAPTTFPVSADTRLPIPVSSEGHTFIGWYLDAGFNEQIFSLPTEDGAGITLYAKWRMIVSEDFQDEEDKTDLYCPDENTKGLNKTTNDSLSLELNTKTGTAFKTVDDGNGNTYLEWTSGYKDPLVRIHGSLTKWIGTETAVTYTLRLAKDQEKLPIASTFRVQQTSNQSFPVFTTTTEGKILLNGKTNLVVGELTEDLTKYIFTVDFAAATISVHNEDGTVATMDDGTPLIVTGLTVPTKTGATDNATDLIDYIGKTNYAFSWQDTTSNDKSGTILIDDVTVISGHYAQKVYTEDSTDVLYPNFGGALPEELPLNYDRENGTVLPETVTPPSKVLTFGGWYSDEALTVPVTEIKAGTKGPVKVYAKWISYTESTNAIIYNGIDVAELPEDTNFYHSATEETPLPVLTNAPAGYGFGGWYSDEALTKRILAVPAGETSQYTVYLKWVPVLAEDYDETTINIFNKNGSNSSAYSGLKNVLNYNANKKVGAGFETVDDGNGGKYLVWTKGNVDDYNALTDEEKAGTSLSNGNPAYDPQFQKNGKLYEFLGEETSFTFSVDLSKNVISEDGESITYDTLYNTTVYIRVSGNNSFTLFSTDSEGYVYLGAYSKGIKIGQIGEDFTRITVSFDFITGYLRAYDEDGNLMTDDSGNVLGMTVSVPSSAPKKEDGSTMTMLEWRDTLVNYYFVWYASGSPRGSMRVDNIDFRGGLPYGAYTEAAPEA